YLFSSYGDHRALHSFPTRRSSDLLSSLKQSASTSNRASDRASLPMQFQSSARRWSKLRRLAMPVRPSRIEDSRRARLASSSSCTTRARWMAPATCAATASKTRQACGVKKSRSVLSRFSTPSRRPRWRIGTRYSERTESCPRSEEHTSELQSRENLVCRLLLGKKTADTKT